MFAYRLTPTRTLLGSSDTAQIKNHTVNRNNHDYNYTKQLGTTRKQYLKSKHHSRPASKYRRFFQDPTQIFKVCSLKGSPHLFILLFSTEPTDRHSSVPKRTHYHGDFLPLALGGIGSGSDPTRSVLNTGMVTSLLSQFENLDMYKLHFFFFFTQT